jgi:hypothetical protein
MILIFMKDMIMINRKTKIKEGRRVIRRKRRRKK